MIGLLLSLLNRLLPKRRVVSFASVPDFADNARAFFMYLSHDGHAKDTVFAGHELVWHVENVALVSKQVSALAPQLPVTVVKKGSPRSLFKFLTSDFIVSTHGLYNVIKPTRKQVRLLLWHGMPLKRIGYMNDIDREQGVQSADYYFVTSPLFQELFEQIFRATKQQVLITGQPRNDVLFQLTDATRQQIEANFGPHYMMFLPTYRRQSEAEAGDAGQRQALWGGDQPAWAALNAVLAERGERMVIKPHPMEQQVDAEFFSGLDQIRVVTDEWLLDHGLTLYELLAEAQELVTDYSSVYVDYLLLNRPIGFLLADLANYQQSRGFVFEQPLDKLPGQIFEEFSGITDFLQAEDTYREARSMLNKEFNAVQGPTAAANVLASVDREVRSITAK